MNRQRRCFLISAGALAVGSSLPGGLRRGRALWAVLSERVGLEKWDRSRPVLVHRINRSDDGAFRKAAPGRDMAAWLRHRWAGVTLRGLGSACGLLKTDSVSNLVRRADQQSK